jgi:hypothetical protein
MNMTQVRFHIWKWRSNNSYSKTQISNPTPNWFLYIVCKNHSYNIVLWHHDIKLKQKSLWICMIWCTVVRETSKQCLLKIIDRMIKPLWNDFPWTALVWVWFPITTSGHVCLSGCVRIVFKHSWLRHLCLGMHVWPELVMENHTHTPAVHWKSHT